MKKKIFIFVGGLGDSLLETFKPLIQKLEKENHKIVTSFSGGDKYKNWSFSDRVKTVTSAVNFKHSEGGPPIFLVGQSAGGLAVQLAAEKVSEKIAGVIALSPALPLGYSLPTSTVRSLVRKKENFFRLILGMKLNPTKEEYLKLISPIFNETDSEKLVDSRNIISGREARRLAFLPPKTPKALNPTLIVFGDSDNWISSLALEKYAERKIERESKYVSILKVENSGHMTFFSPKREEVVDKIVDWTNSVIWIEPLDGPVAIK